MKLTRNLDFFFRSVSAISTPYRWKFTEGYSNNSMTCYYGYFTPTGDQQTTQSFQFINETPSSTTVFRSSSTVISSATSTATSASSHSSLSTGAKAGIAVAVIAAVALLIFAAAYFILRRHKSRRPANHIPIYEEDRAPVYDKPELANDQVEMGSHKCPVEAPALDMPQELQTVHHVQELPGSMDWDEPARIKTNQSPNTNR